MNYRFLWKEKEFFEGEKYIILGFLDDLSSFSKETSVEKNEEKLNINFKFKINEEALDREARTDYR